MTSLPQTAPSRLARPASNGQLPGPVLMQPPGGANALTGADVWRVIRSNIWIILGTLTVAAVIGYLANMWLLAKFSRYTSTGLLAVRTTVEMPHGGDYWGGGVNTAELEIEQRTHAKQLLHERLLTEVLADNNSPIRQTQWFRQFIVHRNGEDIPDPNAAKEDLLQHLDVAPVTNSRLIEVRMSYSVPKDCQTIVQQLCDRYIKQTRLQQSGQQNDRLQLLQNLHVAYDGTIASKTNQINQLIRELSANGVSIGGGGSAKDIELSALITQQLAANMKLIEAQSKLEGFERSVKAGVVPSVEQRVSLDSRVYNLRTQVTNDEARYNDALLQFGPNHNTTKAVKNQLDFIRGQLADEEAQVRDEQVNYEREFLQGEYAALKQSSAEVNDRILKLKQEIADLSSRRNEVEKLMKERDDVRQKLDKVQDDQDRLGLVMGNDKLSPIDWSAQPDLPDRPSFPRLWIVMGATLSLGLALSLGIAFLREMTDTTVRSPRDVARVGQMTLLGMIPHADDDPQLAGARLPLAIYEAPHSMIAEQFRQVRTRLQHIASLDTTRSILVTGCSPEDGKTTVAANLAAGLALNGRRILLVDANFRRPQIHSVMNVSNAIGFGDALNDPTSFDDAVRATEVPNLSVMPLGNRPSNPTELLESQLLIDFIERALEEYDHVIFDGGPLLMVSDAIALAPRVDGVITVVRARGNSRGLLQRVRDELRRLKAEHLGVILNAVRSQGGGYYGPMIKKYYAYSNR